MRYLLLCDVSRVNYITCNSTLNVEEQKRRTEFELLY